MALKSIAKEEGHTFGDSNNVPQKFFPRLAGVRPEVAFERGDEKSLIMIP